MKDLQLEKQNLKKDQGTLRKKIQTDWSEIKQSVTPRNLLKSLIYRTVPKQYGQRKKTGNLFKRSFTKGLTLINNLIFGQEDK